MSSSSAQFLQICNARLLDPASKLDQVTDLYLAEGKIQALGTPPANFIPERVLDARGLCLCPGLIDLCARLRETGNKPTATIASETRAAASAGITTLCCPPDTFPIIDTPAITQLVLQLAEHAGYTRVLPIGALTQNLAGRMLTEMAALKQAGCVAVSQAGHPIRNTQIQRRAFEYATTFNLTIFVHPLDYDLSEGGCMHEGMMSTRLGLPGIPEAAETVAIARELVLAEQTGARIHFRGLSTARGVEMLAEAQARGISVTGDVNIHQLFLIDEDLKNFDPNYHLIPPVRTSVDRAALRTAVKTGVLSAICSDHQPHDEDAKLAPFPETAPGISSLETLLPLALNLVKEGVLDLLDVLERLTLGPARVLKRDIGRIAPGDPADLCLFDLQRTWVPTKATLLSQGRHSPFLDQTMIGQAIYTIIDGRVIDARNPLINY